MDNQNTKIMLFKSRSVSGRLHTAFKFINDNFRVLLKLGSYIIIPVSVIATLYAFFYNTRIDVVGTQLSVPQAVTSLVLLVLVTLALLVGGALFYGLIIHLIELSQERELTLSLSWKEIKTPVLKKSLKLIGVFVVIPVCMLLFIVVIGALAWASLYTLILTVPLFIAVVIPTLLSPYIAILEKKGIFSTLGYTYKIGFRYWGSTFAVHFAMTMVMVLIQIIALLPFYISILIYSLYLESTQLGDAAELPFYFMIFYFILALFGLAVGYLASVLPITGNAFQYGSITALRHEIETFEQESSTR